ncbi:MAG: dihydrolipoyl dehydrogenase [Gammaproteobacteria bacterium]
MSLVEVRIPEMGDAKGVTVVDVLVKKGSEIRIDDPLITLETEKASMDVPSTVNGIIESIDINKGVVVAAGALIATVRVAGAVAAAPTAATRAATIEAPAAPPADTAAAATVSASSSSGVPAATPGAVDLVVLGAGVGGYTAAFRAADLGLKVTLIERWPMLGGVCLNVGCIPSKALLHAAKVIEEAAGMAGSGIVFGPPQIDRDQLRAWKNRVVTRLTNGLTLLAKQRKVEVIQGEAKFSGPFSLEVTGASGLRRVDFKQCIIAAGSESARLPGFPDDPRVIDSTGALELPPEVKRLLVIGGGIIGLEMACVYDALGVRVTVVELSDGLMPGTDRDLVRPLQKRIEKRYERILIKTKVAKLESLPDGLRATFEGPEAPEPQVFDRVLVAVGRTANGNEINAVAAGVVVNARGIIAVNKQMRTNVPHIFAIGDVVGAPMLAHKASHEAKIAAEVAAGQKSFFDARCIPSVAYTDPEIAWAGINENDAKAQGIEYGKGTFPWTASGRALALNRDEGFTKILFDKQTHRIIGAGIVGTSAGDLIAEVALAIEMGADAADIGLTIHAHPTLSETVAFAAEAFEGTLTDLYIPKR